MKIRFWGVRGSIPTPWAEAMRVGGNTSCVELMTESPDLIILDAGTGLRFLSKSLIDRDLHRDRRIHLILSHTHWDHIQGLPFFSLLNYPENHLTIYGANKPDQTLEHVIRQQMTPAYFPVSLSDVAAKVDFCPLEPGEWILGNLKIETAAFCHPGGVYGYRIQEDQQILIYATDMEYQPHALDPALIRFAHNADVLISDAQYTADELAGKVGWGHSSHLTASALARAAHVKKLYLFSHDPDHSDNQLEQMEKEAQVDFSQSFLAREGQIIALGDD